MQLRFTTNILICFFFFLLGDFNKASKNRNICLEISNSHGAHHNGGGVVQSD